MQHVISTIKRVNMVSIIVFIVGFFIALAVAVYSYYQQKMEIQNIDGITKYFDDCLESLKRTQVPEGHDKETSIAYLSRPEVKSRFLETILDFKSDVTISGGFKSMLQLVYLELDVAEVNGPRKVTLTFWPCSCGCKC